MSSLRSAMAIATAVLIVCIGIATVNARNTSAITQATLAGITILPDDPPKTCPITTPPAHPFVLPAPYSSAKIDSHSFWFGTEKLWTFLPANGTWRGLSHYTPDDPTFRQKLFWWRQGYDVRKEPQPKLTITGRRLDASAPPLLADRANNGWVQPDQPFMVVGINFPTLGCWEIKGRYQEDELTFVVWVAP